MFQQIVIPVAAAALIIFLARGTALAHCDTLDGPVVQSAMQSLKTGDLNHALIWVRPGDEAEVRKAFARTLAVRSLSPEARELSDRSFFETLVRVHRAGEGAPYTGLKEGPTEPVVAAADSALADGQLEPLAHRLIREVHQGLHDRYDRVRTAREFRSDGVEAGRRYVQAYVEYVHYVEGLESAAGAAAHAHEGEEGRKEVHNHDHGQK